MRDTATTAGAVRAGTGCSGNSQRNRTTTAAAAPRGSLGLAAVAAWIAAAGSPTATQAADFAVLHTFSGGPDDGLFASGGPVLAGSTLYGLTLRGGAVGWGTAYKVNTDGTGFGLLHSFGGTAPDGLPDGSDPLDGPTLVGSTLYGTTQFVDGAQARPGGTAFRLALDGGGYEVIHRFDTTPQAYDGRTPFASVTPLGPYLYGTTSNGGVSDLGTLYRMRPDGSEFAVLRRFGVGETPGGLPVNRLVSDGAALYGTAGGVLFRVQPDGSGYAVVHAFQPSTEGVGGPLLLVGSTLYGAAVGNGPAGKGTLFRMNVDGSGFAVLHAFGTVAGDGLSPDGGLTLIGSELYGMASEGGPQDKGTIYRIGLDGSGYQTVHPTGGVGTMIYDGQSVYGYGGNASSLVPEERETYLFRLLVPEPASAGLLVLPLAMGRCWRRIAHDITPTP